MLLAPKESEQRLHGVTHFTGRLRHPRVILYRHRREDWQWGPTVESQVVRMGRAKRNPSRLLLVVMGFASLYPSYNPCRNTTDLILRGRAAASRRMAAGDMRASWFETALARLLTMRARECVCDKFNTTAAPGVALAEPGQITSDYRKSCQAPQIKNISLVTSGKSLAGVRAPGPHEGRFAIVTIRWARGCDGRVCSADDWTKSVRRSRVVLAPRCWRQVLREVFCRRR